MGRFFRFVKITFFLAGCFSAIMMFSAFNSSPDVQMGFGEGLHKKVLEGIESGKIKLQQSLGYGDSADLDLQAAREHTVEFIQNVEEQKARDFKANEERKNSFIYHHNGKKWVFFQGEYHEYNPKNVYMVNGIKTFYKPPASSNGPVETARSQSRVVSQQFVRTAQAPAPAADNSEIMNPSQVYSKDGVKQLQQNLKLINQQMQERNRALRALQNQ